jgi:hypothetical protein
MDVSLSPSLAATHAGECILHGTVCYGRLRGTEDESRRMAAAQENPGYDLFISYSTDPDAALARELERFLESFHHLKTPSTIALRALNICRDGSDFSLTRLRARDTTDQDAVDTLIGDYLERSQRLLVICSGRAMKSQWVDLEVRWFLEHRGAEYVFLAVGEGHDPGSQCESTFSPTILAAGLHRKPWYDFREFKGRAARAWTKVKGFDDERVRLAADLNGASAGAVQPIWFREQARTKRRRRIAASIATTLLFAATAVALYQSVVARREQGLKLISDTYELLYREPSAAFLKAFDAATLVPGEASRAALAAAYKVAVLHHYNRRETEQFSGSGSSDFAGRWKEGDVLTAASPDGHHRLVVTERGEDGANPPGDVYLINNESLRTVKLESCLRYSGARRVEDAGFDETSNRVFVSRYYEVGMYELSGRCVGSVDMSCCTKSPVHLVRGLLADRLAIVAETKGGLWLVDMKDPKPREMVLQREFHGDAALAARLSSDRRRAVVVFESGRAALVTLQADGRPSMRDIIKAGVLFAAFEPGSSDRLVTSGSDGTVRSWQITSAETRETSSQDIADTAIDWLSISDDGTRMLAVGADQYLYVIDRSTARVLASVRDESIDWAGVRTVAFNALPTDPERKASPIVRPRSNAALRAGRTFEGAGRKWIVAEEPSKYYGRKVTYLVDGDDAVTYHGMAIDTPAADEYIGMSADTQAVEQHGDLLWLRSSLPGTDAFAGPLLRLADREAFFYPNAKAWVWSLVVRDGKTYLGTSYGLWVLAGEKLTQITRGDLWVREIHPTGAQLWLATNRGGYVVENDGVMRVTEPFVDVTKIVELDGRIWMLTRASGSPGPVHLVDGYFSQPFPNRSVAVADVVEAAGRVWLLGTKGLYLFDGGRARAVAGVPVPINAVREANGKLVLETWTDGLHLAAGPSYELDPASLQVSRLSNVQTGE